MASKAIQTIYEDKIFNIIRDRNSDEIFNIIDAVADYWSFDLESRKPNVMFEENGTKVTDLDLLTFLYSLKNRHAVIRIPNYQSLRSYSPTKDKEVINVSKDRHGKIIKLNANQNTFNFSVMLDDMTVIDSSTVGRPRLFTITDFNGEWYSGWDTIDFVPDSKENQYIFEHYLNNKDKTISFNTFISNSRWVTFFSKHYIITKLLIQELKDRAQYYFQTMKDMKASGKIKFNTIPSDVPTGDVFDETESVKSKTKPKKISVTAFNVEIDTNENTSEYTKLEYNLTEYERIRNLRNDIIHKYVPKLQVMTRAAEYAHFKNPNSTPSWITEMWENKYKLTTRAKIEWDKLTLLNSDNKFLAIRKRTWEKEETVSGKYEE